MLKIEDKIELLGRMHQMVLAKIGKVHGIQRNIRCVGF